MSELFDVTGIGSVSVDFVGTSSQWPTRGSKQMLEDFEIHDGGLTASALVAVSRLGGRARFIGKLGYSELASRAIYRLNEESIDTSLLVRQEGCEPITAFVIIHRETGQRTIFFSRKGVEYPLPEELPEQDWARKTRAFLFTGGSGQPGIDTARLARESNCPVIVDLERIEASTEEALEVSDHVVVGEEFARTYTGLFKIGDMLTALRRREEQVAVITLGERGCAALCSEGCFEIPPYAVETVDTTGCGDVFHGVYALGIARSRSVEQSCRMASAAAALSATKKGCRTGIPTSNEVNSLL